MPNERTGNQDHGRARVLNSFILLTLPWLCFQRDMLAVMKKAIEDGSYVRPAQYLMLRELHALMMTLDPSRSWRGIFDGAFEARAEGKDAETFLQKSISGSIQFIEAQEILLTRIVESLDKLRKGGKASISATKKVPELTDQA
jgi:hypothetical protein